MLLWWLIIISGIAALTLLPQVRSRLASIFGRFWRTGNRLAILIILPILAWPVFMYLIALASPPLPKIAAIALAFSPIPMAMVLLLGVIPPLTLPFSALITAVILGLLEKAGIVEKGRTTEVLKVEWRTIQWIFNIISVELLVGLYFVIVPIKNNPNLASVVLLSFYILLFLSLGTGWGLGRAAKRLLVVLVAIITVVLFWGDTQRRTEAKIGQIQQSAKTQREISCPEVLPPKHNSYLDIPKSCIKVLIAEETGWFRRSPGMMSGSLQPQGRILVVPWGGEEPFEDGPGINNYGKNIAYGPAGQMYRLKSLESGPVEVVISHYSRPLK